MKKMILVAMLLIGTIQGAEKREQWTVWKELPLLVDGNVRILGSKEGCFIDIAEQLALSIPKFRNHVQQTGLSFRLSISNAEQHDLMMLESYAKLRNSKDNEQLLEEAIKCFSLEALCRQTIFLGSFYGELVPYGFAAAWRHQLNECGIGKGTVESLIENEDVVNFIYGAFQDQKALKEKSDLNSSGVANDSNGLKPVYIPHGELSIFGITPNPGSSKKESNSKITQVIAKASNFWKQRSFFERCAAGSLFSFAVIFSLCKILSRN